MDKRRSSRQAHKSIRTFSNYQYAGKHELITWVFLAITLGKEATKGKICAARSMDDSNKYTAHHKTIFS